MTRGAVGIVVASGRALFTVALTALSFFSFLIEAPCLPPSIDFFWIYKKIYIYIYRQSLNSKLILKPYYSNQQYFWSYGIFKRRLKQNFTLFSSPSPSLVSPSAFSESKAIPPAFSKRSSKESSSNYIKCRNDTQIQATNRNI